MDKSAIAPEDVTITVDGTSQTPASTQELTGDLYIEVSDSFTLDGTDNVDVVIENVEAPNNGTFTGELVFDDASNDAIASNTSEYTISEADDNSVTFEDQDSLGDSVLVDQATTNETDAFLAVWNTTDGGAPDTVLGVVPFDGSSTLENQNVDLDPELEEDQELIAAVHPDDGTGSPDTDTIYAADTAQITVVEPDESADTSDDVPTLWQGQIILVTGDFTAGDDYQIREVDGSQDDREVGDLVREVRSLQDGQLIVRTSRIGSGLYVLEEDNKRLSSGDSLASNLSDDENFGFEIAVQDLDVELEDDSVVEGNNVSATFDSNRAGYNMTVEATDEDGDTTTLTTFSDLGDFEEDVQIPFDVDPGNYTVNFTVDDSTAEDSAEVEVREEADVEAEFIADANTYTVPRGDVAEIEIEGQPGEEVTLVFGDEQKNNYEVDIVAEPDDDGNLTITANTFAAGDDRTTDETPGLIFTAEEGEIHDINRTSGVDVPGVLDRGDYDLTLQEAPGDATEFDIGVLRITRSGYESLNQYRGPAGQFGDFDSEENVRTGIDDGNLTESEIVTMTHRERSGATERTDVLVHEARISGIYGALDLIQKATEDDLTDRELLQVAQNATGDQGAILGVEFTQTNFEQNRNPKAATFAPEDEAYRFIIDEDNGSLYLVTNVRDLDVSRTETVGDDTQTETGERYNITIEVGEGLEDQFEANGIDFESPEGADTVNLSIEDREAEFNTTGGEIQVEPDSGQEISGTTNVAPGTEMSVQVQATSGTRVADEPEPEDETPIFQRVEVTVGPNGTFSSEAFDFSENEVGRTFFVLATRQGFEDDAETEGVVVEGEQAAVSLSDVSATEGESVDTITVDSVFVPSGGFVTIHDGTLLDGATFDSVRGTSEYLSEGEHSNVEVALDDPYTEEGTAIAMPHQDTNDNQQYDFLTSEGEEDGPYTDADGNAVIDEASVTFEPEETPTPTATATPEPSTPTATATDEPEPTDTPEPEDQAGFGAVIALIALLGAALLAARRNAF